MPEKKPQLFYKGDWDINPDTKVPEKIINATVRHVIILEASMLSRLNNRTSYTTEEIKKAIQPYTEGLESVGVQDYRGKVAEGVLNLLIKNTKTLSD